MCQDVYPDEAALTEALRLIFRRQHKRACLEILDREKNAHTSTYASETIRIRLDGSSIVLLHCKYSHEDKHHVSSGHRGGVEYEANVYEKLLAPLQVSAPRYFGSCKHDRTWLFLEHLKLGLKALGREGLGIQHVGHKGVLVPGPAHAIDV